MRSSQFANNLFLLCIDTAVLEYSSTRVLEYCTIILVIVGQVGTQCHVHNVMSHAGLAAVSFPPSFKAQTEKIVCTFL
jgi:hypothetical protein